MKITALEEYGLRCLLMMAQRPPGTSVTVAEIAAHEGLTVPYVGKLMAALRQAELVASVRGRGGGYVLARPADQITVDDILNRLGEPLFSSHYCSSHPGTLSVCAHDGDCSIRSVWQVLGDVIQQVLRNTSLADLCMQEARLSSRFRTSLSSSLLSIVSSNPAGSPMAAALSATGMGGNQDATAGMASALPDVPDPGTSLASETPPAGLIPPPSVMR